MKKKGKVVAILYIAGGAIGLVIIVLLARFIINSRYRSQIPEIQDSQSLSQPVRDQISDAFKKAYHHPNADNLGMLGMVYHSCANYDQAAQCYKLAIKRKRSDWRWDYYNGYLNVEMGKADAAIENFNRVLEINPDASLAWYYLGEEYKNIRNDSLAERSFGRIADSRYNYTGSETSTRQDHFPLNAYALFELSRIYMDSARLDLAEKTLKLDISRNALFGPAYRLLGNIYDMKGDKTQSERYTTRAADLVNLSPPVDTVVDKLVLLSRSDLYLLKRIDEAQKSIYPEWSVRLVRHALEYLPDNKYLISKAIKIYLWQKMYKQAVALVDQEINNYHGDYVEMNNLALMFYQSGLYPQAVKFWNVALDLKPKNARIRENMAICYWSTDDKQKSQEVLNDLYKEYREYPDTLADINYLLFHLGERQKAIDNLTKLKQRVPSNPVVQKMSAEIAESRGQLSKAIDLYESSFRGNPKDLKTIQYLGNLLSRQKKWDMYIKLYKDALEYQPNDPDILGTLGSVLINCPDPFFRNLDEGIEYSERAFTHYGSSTNTMISSGRSLTVAYAMLGQKQKAITSISKTINIARSANIPKSYQADLEKMLKTLQQTN